MRRVGKVGLTVVFFLSVLTGGATAATASQDQESEWQSPRASELTLDDSTTMALIFGHEPSEKEIEAYIARFGSIPSDTEIAAYVAATEKEEATLANALNPQPMAHPGEELYYYFSSAKWITRSGVYSLSLMPRNITVTSSTVLSWHPVYLNFNLTNPWSRYKAQGADASMRYQYNCHYRYGMIKTPWNLEPHKRLADINSITCN